MKRPLATDTFGHDEHQAVLAVVRSGRLTMGERVSAFEDAYAAWLGARYCVAVNSGSSAVLLMVAAYTLRGIQQRYDGLSRPIPPTVVVPAVGWATSYSPFQQYGWRLIFVDIDRATLNYDLAALRGACNKYEPDAILAIHLLGNPNDLAAFPLGIPILEDNCEAMGAEYLVTGPSQVADFSLHAQKTGTFGVMAAHSTYFSHHMSTVEGGMVTTDDETLYHYLLALRSHGWTRHLPDANAFSVEPTLFSFVVPGYNVRPTEIQAALGLVQLKRLDGFLAQRRDNAARFPWATQHEIGQSSWFSMYLPEQTRVMTEWKFEVASAHAWALKHFETRPVMSGNFLRQPVMVRPVSAAARYHYQVFGDTPNADWVDAHGLLIGNSHERIDWTALS